MSNWLGSGASEALVLAPWVSLQPTSMSMDSIFVHKLKGSADSMYSRCRQVGHRGGRTDQGTTCKFAVYNEAVNRTPGSHRTIADGSVRPESSWRRQYEAEERRATIVDYQPESFEQVFAARPGRIWGRFAQVFFEVCEVLSALVADQVTKEDTTPRRIRESATRLGPNFVKIGQALASRPDLVGDAVAGELLLLQDAMPIFPTEIARECIREVRLVSTAKPPASEGNPRGSQDAETSGGSRCELIRATVPVESPFCGNFRWNTDGEVSSRTPQPASLGYFELTSATQFASGLVSKRAPVRCCVDEALQ